MTVTGSESERTYLGIVDEGGPVLAVEPLLEGLERKEAKYFRGEYDESKDWQRTQHVHNFPVRSQT